MTRRIDILAPAGSMESLRAAVFSGADAVYLGVQRFNARASADNFTYEGLKEAVSFCHARNVKVNVTINTILYDSELERFKQAVETMAGLGVDAFITQDLAAARMVREICPGIALHGSTQMAVHSPAGAFRLREMGFSRVILAREMTLEQISEITEKVDIETEVFLHGALCVSLSGQCYASAFLGGRSGNRGRCAGTCRLPMSRRGDISDNHLSLKDLCAMDLLRRIEEAGVSCVKIEGRLRSPEYVAAAVSSARSVLNGGIYDRQMLADAFSRSGFTNAFMEGKVDGSVFGARTEKDMEKSRDVLPSLRRIYRREMQRVPVDMNLVMDDEGASLILTDSKYTVEERIDAPVFDYGGDFRAVALSSMSSLGGTPFILRDASFRLVEGKAFRRALLNEARKNAADRLLDLRSQIPLSTVHTFSIPDTVHVRKVPELIARFERPDQIPMEYADRFGYIVIHAETAEDVFGILSLGLDRDRIAVELSRDIFGREDEIRQVIAAAEQGGITAFCAQNIGHLPLLRGRKVMGSFTLNVSNSVARREYVSAGVGIVTMSVELDLEKISRIDGRVTTAVLGYGHIPLMLTKACPLQNVRRCASCDGKGGLTDRTGRVLPVRCHRGIKGYREIFNPVPIYMGDRTKDISSDYVILHFTIESAKRAAKVTEMFFEGARFDSEFTRGLYNRASL